MRLTTFTVSMPSSGISVLPAGASAVAGGYARPWAGEPGGRLPSVGTSVSGGMRTTRRFPQHIDLDPQRPRPRGGSG